MTKEKTEPYRKLAIYGFEVAECAHNFVALLDFDITDLRKKLREKRVTGSRGSLFSFFLKAIGISIEKFPELNSMINLKKRTQFKEIDIAIPIELDVFGKKYTKQIIIRDIKSKTITQIDNEIETSKSNQSTDLGYTSEKTLKLLNILPPFIVRTIYKLALMNHKKVKELSGTVFVTSVSMFSSASGYIIPFSGGPKAVSFAIGSTLKKTVVINNEIVIREMINITAIFNHDIIDGAMAARFINQLRLLIEKDYYQLIEEKT